MFGFRSKRGWGDARMGIVGKRGHFELNVGDAQARAAFQRLSGVVFFEGRLGAWLKFEPCPCESVLSSDASGAVQTFKMAFPGKSSVPRAKASPSARFEARESGVESCSRFERGACPANRHLGALRRVDLAPTWYEWPRGDVEVEVKGGDGTSRCGPTNDVHCSLITPVGSIPTQIKYPCRLGVFTPAAHFTISRCQFQA
jgi:hypothetical protein